MVVSLSRLLQSFGHSASDDAHLDSALDTEQLPPISYPSTEPNNPTTPHSESELAASNRHTQHSASQDSSLQHNPPDSRLNQQLRAERVTQAVAQVNNTHAPTPLTDRYLALRKNRQYPNRPPFDPNSLWILKHGKCPIMTELIDVVDESTLNAMPIEAVAVLDRINHKLSRYREWSTELNDSQEEWICERKYVINKLIKESIPEAINYYEQLLRFSPHRTKNNIVQGNMTAGDLLTDLFLEIDYELDELLDELHQMVVSRLASTHRYVKSRTQN